MICTPWCLHCGAWLSVCGVLSLRTGACDEARPTFDATKCGDWLLPVSVDKTQSPHTSSQACLAWWLPAYSRTRMQPPLDSRPVLTVLLLLCCLRPVDQLSNTVPQSSYHQHQWPTGSWVLCRVRCAGSARCPAMTRAGWGWASSRPHDSLCLSECVLAGWHASWAGVCEWRGWGVLVRVGGASVIEHRAAFDQQLKAAGSTAVLKLALTHDHFSTV